MMKYYLAQDSSAQDSSGAGWPWISRRTKMSERVARTYPHPKKKKEKRNWSLGPPPHSYPLITPYACLQQVLTIEDLRRTFMAIYPCFIAMTTFFHNETGGGLAWRTATRSCKPFITLSPQIYFAMVEKFWASILWNAQKWIDSFQHGLRKCFISMFWNARWWRVFKAFYRKLVHHSWRKFWILMVWNVGEWSIFNMLSAHK